MNVLLYKNVLKVNLFTVYKMIPLYTLCPGHDVKLHPSSATGNQQSPCAGPKPGQNEEGLSDGWRYTDRKKPDD